MFHWWIILILLAYHFVALVVDLKFLFHYEHPGDRKRKLGLLAKINILMCLQFSWHLVSGLPTDVYNTAFDGGFNMILFWELTHLFILLYIAFPLPFSGFSVEPVSDFALERKAPWKKGLCVAIMTTISASVLAVVFWVLFKNFQLSIDLGDFCSKDLAMCGYGNSTENPSCSVVNNMCDPTEEKNEYNCTMSFLTSITVLLPIIGYFPFAFFAAVGIVAVPFDLLLKFKYRPRPIDIDEYSEKKHVLSRKAGELRAAGTELKQRDLEAKLLTGFGGARVRLHIAREMKKFRQSAFLLEEEYRDLNISMKERGENPALSYAKLTLGICSLLLSLGFWIHILLNVLIPPLLPEEKRDFAPDYINSFLCWLASLQTYFLDLILFGFLSVYILICVMKGVSKFGMRFFFCYPIHPLKKDDTHLGGILFNTTIILLASTVLPYFCIEIFSGYTGGTSASVTANYIFPNLRIFGVLFDVKFFIWFLFVLCFVTFFYLLVRPRDKMSVGLNLNEIEPTIEMTFGKPRKMNKK
eukprot:GHVP01062825.1.p1 GENE.GHVP01062825.1~~GHVP01062825.1.p1  ORF type:complete len:526 (+),score=72.38 GHVP01062825.1:87-1664(+)